MIKISPENLAYEKFAAERHKVENVIAQIESIWQITKATEEQ
jgi:hypothetical protein